MVKVIDNRDGRILDAAMTLAEEAGYQWITRDAVATLAEVAPGTVNNAYGSMVELKRAVLREAIARQVLSIIAQGLGDKHPIMDECPKDLKEAAAALLTA